MVKWIPLSLLMFALGACGSHPQSAEVVRGLVAADVQGAMTVSYEGAGTFHESEMGSRPGTQTPLTEPGRAFRLASEGAGTSRGYELSLSLRAARPEVGTYSLRPTDGQLGTFSAVFDDDGRSRKNLYQAFMSASGTVHITASSPDTVEGRFEMSAFRYYARENGKVIFDRHPQRFPHEDYATQPWIEIEGTFVAVYEPPEITVMADEAIGE